MTFSYVLLGKTCRHASSHGSRDISKIMMKPNKWARLTTQFTGKKIRTKVVSYFLGTWRMCLIVQTPLMQFFHSMKTQTHRAVPAMIQLPYYYIITGMILNSPHQGFAVSLNIVVSSADIFHNKAFLGERCCKLIIVGCKFSVWVTQNVFNSLQVCCQNKLLHKTWIPKHICHNVINPSYFYSVQS